MDELIQVRMQFMAALFNIDVDMFKSLLREEVLDERWIRGENIFGTIPFPIWWITLAWEKILEAPEEWVEHYRETIAAKKAANAEIKRIMVDELHIQLSPIDFYHCEVPFYRNETDDDDEEDILCCSKAELLAKGIRMIDIDLFCAVSKFNMAEVERLLELGADVNVVIDDESYDTALDWTATEASCCSSELDYVLFDSLQTCPRFPDLVHLIGWAAHETMYSLLKKYDNRTNEIE